MSLVAIEKSKLTGIGDALRENLGTEKQYTLDEMKSTVKAMGKDGLLCPNEMNLYNIIAMEVE